VADLSRYYFCSHEPNVGCQLPGCASSSHVAQWTYSTVVRRRHECHMAVLLQAIQLRQCHWLVAETVCPNRPCLNFVVYTCGHWTAQSLQGLGTSMTCGPHTGQSMKVVATVQSN
jgi:hypothetical protein